MPAGGRDILAGAVLLVLSSALYVLIPDQVVTTEGDSLTPASLPAGLAVIIGALSAILLIQGMLAYRRADGRTDKDGGLAPRSDLHVAAVIVVMINYAAAIPWLGYLLATAITAGVLALLYGHRRWLQILLLMLIAPPAILYFFRYTMLVLLPEGRLFE